MAGEWFLVGLAGAWLSLYNLPLNTIKGAFLGNSRMTRVAVSLSVCVCVF